MTIQQFPILMLAVVAIVGCSTSPRDPAEAKAIAAIQKLGGKVEFDGNDRMVIKVYLHQTKVKDIDLVVLSQLPKLQNLFLGKTQISDVGLEHLTSLAELKTLALNSTQVTDDGLKSLTGLTNLKTINLQETKVTEKGLARLKTDLPQTRIAY